MAFVIVLSGTSRVKEFWFALLSRHSSGRTQYSLVDRLNSAGKCCTALLLEHAIIVCFCFIRIIRPTIEELFALKLISLLNTRSSLLRLPSRLKFTIPILTRRVKSACPSFRLKIGSLQPGLIKVCLLYSLDQIAISLCHVITFWIYILCSYSSANCSSQWSRTRASIAHRSCWRVLQRPKKVLQKRWRARKKIFREEASWLIFGHYLQKLGILAPLPSYILSHSLSPQRMKLNCGYLESHVLSAIYLLIYIIFISATLNNLSMVSSSSLSNSIRTRI